MVVFQLKERNLIAESTEENELKWFSKKILTEASRQIRDTINYLERNPVINIENHRGHRLDLKLSEINEIHKIICYTPNENLPFFERKFKISKYSGFIHLFPDYDYQGVVKTLITPAELCEYLGFRQEVLERAGSDFSEITEQSLLGLFLTGDFESNPHNDFYKYLSKLDHKIQEWDLSVIIKKFTDRMITENHYSDYYKIISEVAQLKRNELREFKKRFKLSMKNCGVKELVEPYCKASLRTGCGFVFIPLNNDAVKNGS